MILVSPVRAISSNSTLKGNSLTDRKSRDSCITSTSRNPLKKVIIGIGNDFQGDDGIGHYIVQRIQMLNLPNISVFEESGEATHLMEAWSDADIVVIIDAMISHETPGLVCRFDASNEPLPKEFYTHFSTHSFGIAESLELARALGKLPATVIVYGIEGKDFETGHGLSPEVEQTTEIVVDQILLDIA